MVVQTLMLHTCEEVAVAASACTVASFELMQVVFRVCWTRELVQEGKLDKAMCACVHKRKLLYSPTVVV